MIWRVLLQLMPLHFHAEYRDSLLGILSQCEQAAHSLNQMVVSNKEMSADEL